MTNENNDSLCNHIRSACLRLPCPDLDASLTFFSERLGFAVEQIHPADAPNVAVLSGYGMRLRLHAEPAAVPAQNRICIALSCDRAALVGLPNQLTSPCGVRVELCDAEPELHLPPAEPAFIVTHHQANQGWHRGRAGMHYRDLIPGRLGGRFIASHIRIPDGGNVPDYVHYHRVRLQMILCKAGWVRVVYEDQGEPFVLRAGDCVLQPPQIRHRVLEASPGLEVIELGCPAVHETLADHALLLPNERHAPQRVFSGQRFVRHIAAAAPHTQWRAAGFAARDTGIAAATDGLASAKIIRLTDTMPAGTVQATLRHDGELLFLYVLRGSLGLQSPQHGSHTLGQDDSCVIPAGSAFALHAGDGLELLEVCLPG